MSEVEVKEAAGGDAGGGGPPVAGADLIQVSAGKVHDQDVLVIERIQGGQVISVDFVLPDVGRELAREILGIVGDGFAGTFVPRKPKE